MFPADDFHQLIGRGIIFSIIVTMRIRKASYIHCSNYASVQCHCLSISSRCFRVSSTWDMHRFAPGTQTSTVLGGASRIVSETGSMFVDVSISRCLGQISHLARLSTYGS